MAESCTLTFHTSDLLEYGDPGYERPRDEREIRLERSGLPFETLLWLSNHVASLSEEAVSGDLLRLIGRSLYAFLFDQAPPALEQRFRDLCHRQQVSVQLDFAPEAWALASLPWELLYIGDSTRGGFFVAAAADKDLVLTRHVPHQPSVDGMSLKEQMRILVVVANPESERAAVHADELEAFLEEQRKACDAGSFHFEIAYDLDWAETRAKLDEYQPDVFHFRGHGERGALWLARAEEEVRQQREQRRPFSAMPVEAGTLTKGDGVALLFSGPARPKLVVLEACETADEGEFLPGVAGLLVRKVPAVVAMRFLVSQRAANEFVRVLYGALVDGKSVDWAVQRARVQLGSHMREGSPYNDRSFGTPVLYVKASERVCLPLPRKVKGSGKHVQPTQAGDRDCPRCREGEWAGRLCEVCGVRFLCPQCEHEIRRPHKATRCGSCDSLLQNPPWPLPDSFGRSLPRPA